MISTYAQLQKEVKEVKQTEKFSRDLKTNMDVIRDKMINNYKQLFAIYDGGNIELMMKLLRQHDYTVEQLGVSLYVRL